MANPAGAQIYSLLDAPGSASVSGDPLDPAGLTPELKNAGQTALVSAGIELLSNVRELLIKQDLEPLEVFLGIEINNRYKLFNRLGEQILIAAESTPDRDRFCFGGNRPFLIRLISPDAGSVLAVVERKCSCGLCFWGGRIAGSNVTVRSASGELFGSVVQRWSCCTPSFAILDGQGKRVMKISGPCFGSCCHCCMCFDAQFFIKAVATKAQVGIVHKRFRIQETVSDANVFGVTFTAELEPMMKCLILAAVLCIDFSFFESTASRGCDCREPGYYCAILVLVFAAIGLCTLAFYLIVTK